MNSEMTSYRILELGIGRGGGYIESDHPSVFRIGVDIQKTRLRSAHKKYPDIGVIQADAFTDHILNLPFDHESMSAIEIRFPHEDLLFALADSQYSSLWQELHRILIPSGYVELLFDVPSSNARELNIKHLHASVYLENPEDHIWRMATNASFDVSIGTVTRAEAFAIQSDYGMSRAHLMRMDPNHKTYRLLAHKRE